MTSTVFAAPLTGTGAPAARHRAGGTESVQVANASDDIELKWTA